jgi:cellulose synthase/poly-beta-1,6-N-acetylglucosamine synthase-like glycosyltransferase
MSIGQLAVFVAGIILSLFSIVLLVICLLFLVECVAALLSKKTSIKPFINQNCWENIEVTVLVPAHNEELTIATTLDGLIPTLKPRDRLLVVADNCEDTTAKIARSKGVTVIERHNTELRGKGYALDYGLKFLQAEPPDVVVMIDADCTVDKRAITKLSECAIATGKPVQATYLMTTTKSVKSSKDFIAQLSNIVRNLVRLRGQKNLGQSCLLNGTGMAFPWAVINTVNLANGHLLEDLKLGLDLSIAGYQPEFCQSAKVTAHFPQQSQASKIQKTRWVHGHLQIIQTYVPLLLKQAVSQKRFDLLFSALDLCIPPLSLLAVMWFAIMTVSVLFILTGFSWIPTVISALAGLCFLAAILTAWAGFASEELPLIQLLAIPVYVISKIPVFFSFLIKPQKDWVRTKRDYEKKENFTS